MVGIVLVGDGPGVDCRNGDGECGDSGLRNGDALGEPYERGEGLYEADIDYGEGWYVSRWIEEVAIEEQHLRRSQL